VPGNDLSPLTDTEVHYLGSEHVGDEFKVVIGHCGSPDSGALPVLYLGDIAWNFGMALDITRLLRFADFPDILVVGVGYRTADDDENDRLRGRDFTPSVDPAIAGTDPTMMGGADRFLAFLREELRPWVEGRYDVDSSDSTFFGYSLGGLFATHVLLTQPATFRRYGIGSPYLAFNKGELFDREAAYATGHDDLPAKVLFTVGELETPEGRRRFVEQLPNEKRAKAEALDLDYPPDDDVGDAERMVSALRSRGYPSLQVELEVLPGEYHLTAPPMSLSRSLRYLFDAPR
jgi:predicted alpha/beta superfamily hydrolase